MKCLIVALILSVQYSALAQKQSCADFQKSELAKFNVRTVETQLIRIMPTEKKELAYKFILGMRDFFRSVDRAKGQALVGSDPVILLNSAARDFRSRFNVYCGSQVFERPKIEEVDLGEQRNLFFTHIHANRSFSKSTCKGAGYYQMFYLRHNLALLEIGTLGEESEILNFDFHDLTKNMTNLLSIRVRTEFIFHYVASIFTDSYVQIHKNQLSVINSKLEGHFCAPLTESNKLYNIVADAYENVIKKLILATPERGPIAEEPLQ